MSTKNLWVIKENNPLPETANIFEKSFIFSQKKLININLKTSSMF